MENERRKAKGEAVYANYEAMKKAKEAEDEKNMRERNKDPVPEEDPYLIEAGHILADFIKQLQPAEKQVAKQQGAQ